MRIGLGLLGIGQVAFAVAVALLAVWMTISGQPNPGVVVSERADVVLRVLPGGPGWQDGLRPGQEVVELASGIESTTWRLVTSDGATLFGSSYGRHLQALRDAAILAIAALLVALLAVLGLRRLSAAVALAAVSVILSSLAIAPSGDPSTTSATAVLALLAPVSWLGGWGAKATRVRAVLVLAAVALAIAWLIGRYFYLPAFDAFETLRQAGVAAGGLSTIVLLGSARTWRRRLRMPRRRVDIVAAALLVAVALGIAITLELPPVAVVALALVALVLFPRFRATVAGAADRLLLGEVRDRAGIQAVEDERGRIARDLHDAPLQEIAAVIRQLDSKPGTDDEAALLRQVADHLRQLTTELRLPILEDLGLPAALSYLAEQASANSGATVVRLQLVPDEMDGQRPPPDVELAVFRIAQEAVDNALAHAAASTLEISAFVYPQEVVVTITDDGSGLSEAALREAAQEGHFGLASMSQRAALVGATLEIGSSKPRGTRVVVHWRLFG